MRKLHRIANLHQQAQPCRQIRLGAFDVCDERFPAFDELHRVPRLAIVGDTAIKEACDVRVLQPHQNLPLARQPSTCDGILARACTQQFECDGLSKILGLALRPIHLPHAAASDGFAQHERADALADARIGLVLDALRECNHQWSIEQSIGFLIGFQQAQYLLVQGCIRAALLCHPSGALRIGLFQRFAHQAQRLCQTLQLIARGAHVPPATSRSL